VVVDLMGIAADDLDRSKDAELRMADLGAGRCHACRGTGAINRLPG
jgi:hypothetical protein